MADKQLQEQLEELGSKLENPPASKDVVIKLLKQGATCLSDIDQSPPKPVMDSMQPLLNAIVKPALLKHQDREVKLFVAVCICEITRITAPQPPYDDDVLKDTFELIVSTFSGLNETNGPSFARRVVILETLARYRSCVVMLDLECDDLIHEMFRTFFSVARDEHPENVLASMQTIIEVLLDESEDVQEELLLILLSVLGRNKKDVTAAARTLSMNVIKNCAAKLEPGIKQFLMSFLSGDDKPTKYQIDYHEVLYDIYRCAPQILSGLVPFITGELLSDQLDIRLKAVGLVGDLFAVPESTISEVFQPIFLEFLKRLTDRAVEVRMSVLEHVKGCLLGNPFRAETPQIIAALCDRLLDYDENVRKQVVTVVCDLACHAPTSVPLETIKLVAERLRDKSLIVKRYTMERLADVFRAYCSSPATDTKKDECDWIVGKLLRCFYDKDFRSDAIEYILCLSLFPTDFSVKNKVTNWVRMFSRFDKVEVKALEKILEQKQRLQQEMQKYLSLKQSSQDGDASELQKKVLFCFRVMSRYFTDPAKAEENFQILDQLKDSNIWKILKSLLDANTGYLQACVLRDDLLRILGQKHRLYEFLSVLLLKCSYILFSKEHVGEILQEIDIQKSAGNTELIVSCMTILVILARFSPLLLGGIEEQLVHLLEDDNEIIKEGVLHILAKAGGTIREQLGVSSRSLDLILERICIEGSRRQAKYAVYALASITKDDGLMSLSVLYKRLVDMLVEKSHLPAVLQSLGCIAQTALPVFETRESEVANFIRKNLLEIGHVPGDNANESWDDRSELCSLKIFGIKTLVKSYLPVKDAHLRSGIDELMEMLKNLLTFGEITKEVESSSLDKAHMKLAAAKSVLRLSKHWEHKIPVPVFYLTLQTSEADFPMVRKVLLEKIHQYIKDRILDPKYACAFLLDIGSQQLDSEENKRSLNDIIQMCQQGRARQTSIQSDSNSSSLYPEHILPYVVHALAHHSSFPNVDECKDVKAFEATYRQLYFILSMLVHRDEEGKSDATISKDKESIALINSIFQCVKGSEDAVDTAKSKNSYAICDLGLSIVKLLAPNQENLPDLSAPVTLPPVLYRPVEKEQGNDSLVGEGKTWLADEDSLAYFESLKLEANGIVNSEMVEDEIMKDSDIEGSEMPLGKLLKRLKAKAAKARKEVKKDSSPARVQNDFDIMKMVKEINSDSVGKAGKFESSNGHESITRKRRSDHKLEKGKMSFNDGSVPVPKRRRSSSTQGHKSHPMSFSKGAVRQTDADQDKSMVDPTKLEREPQSGSEDKSMHDNITEPTESDLLVSSVKKKSGSLTKKKDKRPVMVRAEVHHSTDDEGKTPKQIMETDSKSGSLKKRKRESFTGLAMCTSKDSDITAGDLINRRIKVWWPMDKKFYEGVVKSFDSEKKKHVILYDDGDVEVLRLEKERWELVDNGPKSEQRNSTSKAVRSKGRSFEQKRKSTGGSKQDEKSAEISSSKARGGSTPAKKVNQKQKSASKSKSVTKSQGSPNIAARKSNKNVKPDASDEDPELNEKIGKSSVFEFQSDKEETPSEDLEKAPRDSEQQPKEEQDDSEATETEDVDVPLNDAHGSDDEAVSSSEGKQPARIEEGHGQEDEEAGKETNATPADKPIKKRQEASKKKQEASSSKKKQAADAESSDDETLSMWKKRVGK